VTSVALSIALFGNDSVFSLVLIAWSALACAFAPILTVYVFGGKPSEATAIAMMVIALAVMFLWRSMGLSSAVYEVGPGILAGLVTYLIANKVSRIKV